MYTQVFKEIEKFYGKKISNNKQFSFSLVKRLPKPKNTVYTHIYTDKISVFYQDVEIDAMKVFLYSGLWITNEKYINATATIKKLEFFIKIHLELALVANKLFACYER